MFGHGFAYLCAHSIVYCAVSSRLRECYLDAFVSVRLPTNNNLCASRLPNQTVSRDHRRVDKYLSNHYIITTWRLKLMHKYGPLKRTARVSDIQSSSWDARAQCAHVHLVRRPTMITARLWIVWKSDDDDEAIWQEQGRKRVLMSFAYMRDRMLKTNIYSVIRRTTPTLVWLNVVYCWWLWP